MSNLLYTIVHEALAATTKNDPREIAADVLGRIPDEALRECLETALVCYVSNKITGSRKGVPTEPSKPAAASKKVASIRSNWAAFLAERVQVDGVWKTIAECTADDVEALAANRREVAARNLAHAKNFERLAVSMRAQGAATVADFKPGRQPQLAKAS